MSASSCVIGAAVALRLKRSTVTAFELLILVATNALATRCTLGVMRGSFAASSLTSSSTRIDEA